MGLCPKIKIKNRLFANIFSLAALQGIGFLLSLATLPYLLRMYSMAEWGGIVFAQLVVNYAIWITNWGYYLGATRDIASSRDDPERLAQLYSAVWQSQFFLMFVVFALLFIACNSIDPFVQNSDLYYASFGMILGNVLMPLWLLNGLELIKSGAIFQMLAKLLTLVLVFLFIDKKASGSLYFYINSFSVLIIAVLMLTWMKRKKLFEFKFQPCRAVLAELRRNAQIFFGSALSTTNNTVFPIFIGLNCGPQELALFNLVDRVKGIGTAIINPIAHSIYPRICYALGQDKDGGMKLARRFVSYMVGISAVMFLAMLVFAEPIVNLLGGAQYSAAKMILMIVAISPVLNTASSNIANQILIANGHASEYFRSLLVVTMFVIPALFVISNYFGLVSSVVLLVLAEFLFLLLIANAVYRLQLNR